MSSSKSPRTICLPAHILDAKISPRAREVLMLLASQTTPENPTVWVCKAAIAERLHCSPVTVKRALQKLIETKLIVETEDLHERRYKFYRVRWNINSVTQALGTPCEEAGVQKTKSKDWMPACAGMTKKESKSAPVSTEEAEPISPVPPIEHAPPPSPRKWIPTPDESFMLQDKTLAYYAEIGRQRHLEYLRRYNIDPNSFR